MIPTTTFAKIKAAGACKPRYRLALRKAGGLHKYGRDTPITIRQIIDAGGLDDALWCLRTMPEHNAKWRQFAVNCARRVQHLLNDPRSLAALDVAERHARGKATDDELAVASDAARAVASDAARDAASDAARDAASYAAWDAARAVASDAAWDAAWDAARVVAWDAARAVASDAAWDAARVVASDAARAAASYAAWDAAWDAAKAAEREWQAAELIRLCEGIEP